MKIDVSSFTRSGKYECTFNGKVIDVSKTVSVKRAIPIAIDAVMERDGEKCRKCSATDQLTLEHIVPRHLLFELGVPEAEQFTDLDNMELLCAPCNHFKSGRLDFSHPRTKSILLKYINRI